MLKMILNSALVTVLFLTSCTKSDPLRDLAQAYLSEATGSEVTIVEMNEAEPWTAADSAAVLKEEFEAVRSDLIEKLNTSITLSQEAIESAEESRKGGFTALEPMINETIETSERTIEMAGMMLEALEGDCKGTILEGTYAKIQDFEAKGESLLYYRLSGLMSTPDSEETAEFTLMASEDKSSILGQL